MMSAWCYSLACNQSLDGKPKAAIKSLERSVELSRNARQVEMMSRDGDLANVRKLPTFKAWYASLVERAKPKLSRAKREESGAK